MHLEAAQGCSNLEWWIRSLTHGFTYLVVSFSTKLTNVPAHMLVSVQNDSPEMVIHVRPDETAAEEETVHSAVC